MRSDKKNYHMKLINSWLVTLLIAGTAVQACGQNNTEEKKVLDFVERFFEALEKQDTAAFQQMFLKDARNFSARELRDSVVIRSQISTAVRLNPSQVIKERMRRASTEVKIHKGIAMVWAPYDLWVNDIFEHCGVDVFTLIKSSNGWKIASIAYTMEKEGCN